MTQDDLRPESEEFERAMADVTREGERVGVDWDVVAESVLSAHPELAPLDDAGGTESAEADAIGPADDGGAETHVRMVEMDVELLLPILRGLADGAGTQAFLEALEQSGEQSGEQPGDEP